MFDCECCRLWDLPRNTIAVSFDCRTSVFHQYFVFIGLHIHTIGRARSGVKCRRTRYRGGGTSRHRSEQVANKPAPQHYAHTTFASGTTVATVASAAMASGDKQLLHSIKQTSMQNSIFLLPFETDQNAPKTDTVCSAFDAHTYTHTHTH